MSSENQNFRVGLLGFVVSVALLLAFSWEISAQEENKNAPPRTGAISGRVVNENGQPVPYAMIYVSSPGEPTQNRTSAADDSGNFHVVGLDSSIYMLSASAPGYVLTPRDPEGLPSYYRLGDSVTISLVKGGVITGVVTAATGEPLVQVGVRAILIRDANGKVPNPGRFVNDRITDDRGVYRIYGLPPGTYVVTAGGRSTYGYGNNPYDADAPTYAPSSTRDTAAEIVVRAGDETTVDIRYRGEPGHAVSGLVSGPISPNSNVSISLSQIVNGVPMASAVSFQSVYGKGFAFYGVADGDYDLSAQSFLGRGESIGSEPRRITVKGADVTGLELVAKELASIRGHVFLEPSPAAECKNKRQPLFSETMLVARRMERSPPKDQSVPANFFAHSPPDKAGDFALRNLPPGDFSLRVQFVAKYWYLRSIVREMPGAQPARSALTNRKTDAARNGISLKFGERISGVAVTLAAGAASLRGTVQAEGDSRPAKIFLVPAEKESAEDVLRFFTTAVDADGTFAFNNLPPGRYFALGRTAANKEPQSDARLRQPEEADLRARLRQAAEAANTVIELKPCQNVNDYQLPFKPAGTEKP